MYDYEVIIVGGGLAGLTAAIDLARRGHQVLLIEKNRYPAHKVCGEYVSNEVQPYLESLGVYVNVCRPVSIDKLLVTTKNGKALNTRLPLGGFGLSRYTFDRFLYGHAKQNGVHFSFDTVMGVRYEEGQFQVDTQAGSRLRTKQVIAAFGKRSNLDLAMKRQFMERKAPWLGVKCHYHHPDFPTDQVELHGFPGGYGGVSKTEDGSINFCYLTTYKSFKRFKNIETFNAEVVSKNHFLREFLKKATPKFEKSLAIAQISFEKKKAVDNHVPMLGDAAGMIHPLCGNGMAMAIHSAKLACEAISPFLQGKRNRLRMEADYQKEWKRNFSKRIWMGRRLQSLLMDNTLAEMTIGTIASSEFLLQKLISATHGKPILN